MKEDKLNFFNDLIIVKKGRMQQMQTSEAVDKIICLLKTQKKSLHNLNEKDLKKLVGIIYSAINMTLINLYVIIEYINKSPSVFSTSKYDPDEFKVVLLNILNRILREIKNIKSYPKKGEVYQKILHTCYIDKTKETGKTMQKRVGIYNSKYYRLKNEAVIIITTKLWDYFFYKDYDKLRVLKRFFDCGALKYHIV